MLELKLILVRSSGRSGRRSVASRIDDLGHRGGVAGEYKISISNDDAGATVRQNADAKSGNFL